MRISNRTTSHRRQLIAGLSDKEYRDLFVEEHIKEGVAFQIRAMREGRQWTQRELGEQAGGKPQAAISNLENPNSGPHTLRSLSEIASALDVALVVRFVPFSQLVDWSVRIDYEDLSVPSFDDDPGIRPEGSLGDEVSTANQCYLQSELPIQYPYFAEDVTPWSVWQQRGDIATKLVPAGQTATT